jgi:ATP-dependent DNA ligase
MIKAKELKIEDVLDLEGKDYSIQLKVDGTRQYWDKDKFLSERGIDNTTKFKHISDVLKNHKVVLDGELALGFNHTVFDITKKENWNKATYWIFDLIELDGFDFRGVCLENRLKQLKYFVESLDCLYIKMIPTFPEVDVAWDYVLKNNLEGIVIKKLNEKYPDVDYFTEVRTDIKVKYKKEGKEKIVGFEQGNVKGAFVLENGSKISSLSSEVGLVWLGMRNKDIYCEFEYLTKTPDGKFFQPILKRLVDDNNNVIWG